MGTLPYFLALLSGLTAHLAVAVLVWVIALCLAPFPSRRPFAKRLAAGMAGTLPGALLLLLLSVPVVVLALLLISGLANLNLPDVVISVLLLCSISIPVVAWLRGLYVGWRVAWEWAAGRSPSEIIASDWLLWRIWRCLF